MNTGYFAKYSAEETYRECWPQRNYADVSGGRAKLGRHDDVAPFFAIKKSQNKATKRSKGKVLR
jgi:hypothetical protein